MKTLRSIYYRFLDKGHILIIVGQLILESEYGNTPEVCFIKIVQVFQLILILNNYSEAQMGYFCQYFYISILSKKLVFTVNPTVSRCYHRSFMSTAYYSLNICLITYSHFLEVN